MPSQDVYPRQSAFLDLSVYVLSLADSYIVKLVRLFAAEDAPAQSSIMLQDLLQAKKARFMHALNPIVSVDLPPGFGPSSLMGVKPLVAPILPSVSWRIPECFKLDPTWLVMAGEESKEVFAQKQRENRTLEAVYPRPSAIPESPAEPSEVQLPFDEDDSNTLIIPVVPLEDDELPEADDLPTTSGSTYKSKQEPFSGLKSLSPPPGFLSTSMPVKPRTWFPVAPLENNNLSLPAHTTPAYGPPVTVNRNIIPPNGTVVQTTNMSNARTGSLGLPVRAAEGGTEPDVPAAAAAAYAALQQSNDTTMIDRELLIKFLTNPSMLQSLSEKLAQNPPGNYGVVNRRIPESVDHSGIGARGNGRVWNPTVTEHAKSGQRHLETAVGITDPHMRHGYDRPPGFGAPSGANALGQAPPQPGQGYAHPGPLTIQSLPLPNMPPPTSVGYDQSIVSGSGRPISQRDEQYYKDLISQHGKNEEDIWGAIGVPETGNSYPGGGRPRASGLDREKRLGSAERTERPERTDSRARWAGREDVDMAGLSIRQGDGDQANRSGQSRGKSRKACIYFSTSRGCRNGSSCAFLHETNNAERAKRPKLEGKESNIGYR
uniref:C3H1-type domain-containing protein n=1 Tax=Physcomitrium patens TaxID=3218 RepID=A0A7I4DZ78_PHYPA